MKRIEMHAKTKYSLDNESTIDIENLILKCVENNEKGITIVDKDSVVSFIKSEKILKQLNIKDFKLIHGIELKIYYKGNDYRCVVLVKNKRGISLLYKLLNVYYKHKNIPLSWLMMFKNNFVLGLIYDKDNYNDEMLKYFDYLEVDKNISKKDIIKLKNKTCVIYSNRINALSEEEILAKKVLYNKLRIKKDVNNRVYQTTEEILSEIDDIEIVIDNPNKIFNMIETFDILDDKMLLPNNEGFDLELLIYFKLYEKFGLDVPEKINKRIKEEIKLIKQYNYDGFINIYKEITDKCKKLKEDYIICDYINYLYIAYLLEIIHFDPIKLDLNYELFFSNCPKISIKVSANMCIILRNFINKDLCLNTIRGKSLMKINGYMLNKSIDKYQEKNNLNLTLEEKSIISKYLDDYPINNNFFTLKDIILPQEKDNYTPSFSYVNDRNESILYTQIDYKDIEDKFMIIEFLPSNKIEKINILKEITKDRIEECNYKDKKIINKTEFKSYLDEFKNNLILDDFYEDLINIGIELPIIFSTINEIKYKKMISKGTKNILNKNNIKLKKYHNINFISRGILNELVKLEYELLYFKEYYPLEYYYVMIKDCNYNEIINNKCNGEYNYILKELYESNIKIDVEEDVIEDHCFKLDKLNNRIILVVNKLENESNKYLNNRLSIIGTRPLNGKMSYMSKVVCNLLNKNKKVIVFGFGGPNNYYLEYLLSEVSKIDREIIHQYLNPCTSYKNKIFDIDKEKYFEGIKYLLNHELIIKDYQSVKNSIIENIDSLLEKIIYMSNDSDIVIIDCLELIKDDLENILKKISKIKNINFIIFTNLKREYEKNRKIEISSFNNYKTIDKYISYISILDYDKLNVIKE